jgi:hypothetical protein
VAITKVSIFIGTFPMASEVDGATAPLSANLRSLDAVPQLSAGSSREALQRDAAGIAPEKPLLPGNPLLLQSQRGESLIDQSSRAADAIAFLRGERRIAIKSDQTLSTTIQGLLADPSLITSTAGFLSVSKLTEMIKALLQRSTAPVQQERSAHQEIQQHEAETLQVKKQKKALDEDEEDLPTEQITPDKPTTPQGLLAKGWGALSDAFSSLVRFVGRVCSEAISGIKTLIRGKPESKIFTPWTPHDSAQSDTVQQAPEPRKHLSLPLEWKERFGDDPAEEVKAIAKSMQVILEELAREEYLEEQAEERKEAQQQEEREERMNELRDELAKLITPLADGTVPAQFLSRHFVGPWITTQDLMHALHDARKARAASLRGLEEPNTSSSADDDR